MITAASFTPVSVETTFTAPDWSAPLTVAEELVIATERVGSELDCAAAGRATPPAHASAISAPAIRSLGIFMGTSEPAVFVIRGSFRAKRRGRAERAVRHGLAPL